MQSLLGARGATRGLSMAMFLASLGTGVAVSLVHCGESSSGAPNDDPDASVPDGTAAPHDGGGGGGTYEPCDSCGPNQVCSNGHCTNIPAQCPCPKGSYCDLGNNRCTRGCTDRYHCSDGEYCDDERACKIGCQDDQSCKDGEFCKSDTRICTVGCRTDGNCTKPELCQVQGANRFCGIRWRKIPGTPQHIESVTVWSAACLFAVTSEETKRPLTYSISEYCPSAKKWNIDKLHFENAGRSVPHIAPFGDRLFIVGGMADTDGGTPTPSSRTTAWNGSTSDVLTMSSLTSPRRTHGLVGYQDHLYAVDHGTVDHYFRDVFGERWGLSSYPSGTLDVAYPGLAHADRFVYATGGLNARGAPTALVWKIDESDPRIVEKIGTLRRPRGRHGLVAKDDGTLYVFGGDATRRSVEVFPAGRELTPLPSDGNVVGAAVLYDGYFYVVTDAGEMITNAP